MIPDFIGLYVMLSVKCCRRTVKLKSNGEWSGFADREGLVGGLWHRKKKPPVKTVFHTNIGHFSQTGKVFPHGGKNLSLSYDVPLDSTTLTLSTDI